MIRFSHVAWVFVLLATPFWANAQTRNPKRVPSALAQSVGVAALRSAGLDSTKSAVWIGPDHALAKPTVAHRAQLTLNPASVMKLVTTAAALQTLGPEHVWHTKLDAVGQIHPASKTLKGHLIVRGGGDPKLVVERLEPMMQGLRNVGIDTIDGDIVLDRRAFTVPPQDPGDFDGEPLRPYNARPDPLLINFKAQVVTFKPSDTQTVEVSVEPPLAGVSVPSQVGAGAGPCGDWRANLNADFSDPNALRFGGNFPLACGERTWPVAYSEPASHSARALAAMWAKVGGQLKGQVINAPNTLPLLQAPSTPLLQHASLPLSEVVRDVNKFSNNVMAQHVFLALASLPTAARAVASIGLVDARRAALAWWARELPGVAAPTFDNGSGLSRIERVSPQALARLLTHMGTSTHAGPYFDSLPDAGIDGTLSALKGSSMQGRAQLKTGTLKDATALAGRFTDAAGAQKIFVAIYNGPAPAKARLAMYCLIQQAAFGGSRAFEGRDLCKK